MCLQAAEKYGKVESIIIQKDYKTASKKWTDKKKSLNLNKKKSLNKKKNVFKFQENKFKIDY